MAKDKTKKANVQENKKESSITATGKKLIKKKKPKAIPRTVQQSLPYIEAYDNGVMQVDEGVFSKTFEFEDIAFQTKSEEEQHEIYENYMKFLNTITPKEDIFFTFVNGVEDEKLKLEKVAPIMRGDKFDTYRKEIEKMIKEKLESSRNNISTKKYMTFKTEADDVDKAMKRISTLSGEIDSNFRKIIRHPSKPLNLSERLEVLNTILNSKQPNYWFKHDANGNVSVDFGEMAKQGLTTKDIIAPEVLKFKGNNFQIGDRFGQAMYLDNVANWMNTNFMADLCAVNFESCITLHISAIPQTDSIKMIHNQSVNITSEVMEKQKKAIQGGYNPDFISTDLKNAKDQVDRLQEDLMNRDQKMFYMSLVLVHFASTEEELKEQSNIIKNVAAKYMSSIKPLFMQQERGLCSAMPMGLDKTYMQRLLTTESLGVFIPFDELSQFDENGLYYGVNSINKSLIVYNRLKGQNYNGLVLGSSGSGKSFSSKREMTNAYLNTDADIYIIDPDGEYTPLANAFDGSIIKIAPGNGVYINPFDLDIDSTHDSDSNPLTMKTDFVCGMLETMLGNGARLTPIQKSIVDRCIRQIYNPYIEHLKELPPDEHGKRPTIDRSQCPTMTSLFDALLNQPQQEAQNLALVMETYTTGSFDTFAHKTNVDLDNRMIVYDIKDIGTNLRELALKVCMNDVWNRMMDNKRKGKWTWFYIDEFHLLLSNQSTSEFLKTVWKRARKWQGVPTGITQNVEDLLNSSEARAIINNSSFVYMLNQSAMDRNMLKELLKLSDNDIEFVTNAEPGHGLIFNGRQAIPFSDNFPRNTELFKVMTTKAENDK